VITASIFAMTGRWAAHYSGALGAGSVVQDALLWIPEHRNQEVSGFSVAEVGILREDPAFDPLAEDYRLGDGSPAIDASDAACEADSEPSCPGEECISDLGYWAGTDQAKAACGE